MSEFKWPAFISYRNHNRTPGDKETGTEYRMNEFALQLCDALTDRLGTRIDKPKPFLDKHNQDALLATDPDKTFAHAICYSACMVVIYTRHYFNKQKTYCTREFLYMQEVENHRNTVLAHDGSQKLHIIVTLDCDAGAVPTPILAQNIVIDALRNTTTAKGRQKIRDRASCEPYINQLADKIQFLFDKHQYNGKIPEFYVPFQNPELEQDDAKVQAFLDTLLPQRTFPTPQRPVC